MQVRLYNQICLHKYFYIYENYLLMSKLAVVANHLLTWVHANDRFLLNTKKCSHRVFKNCLDRFQLFGLSLQIFSDHCSSLGFLLTYFSVKKLYKGFLSIFRALDAITLTPNTYERIFVNVRKTIYFKCIEVKIIKGDLLNNNHLNLTFNI